MRLGLGAVILQALTQRRSAIGQATVDLVHVFASDTLMSMESATLVQAHRSELGPRCLRNPETYASPITVACMHEVVQKAFDA